MKDKDYLYLFPVCLAVGRMATQYKKLGTGLILIAFVFCIACYYYLKCRRNPDIPVKVTKCVLVFAVNMFLCIIGELLFLETNNTLILCLAKFWKYVGFFVVSYYCLTIGINEGINYYTEKKDFDRVKQLKRSLWYFNFAKYVMILFWSIVAADYFKII